MSVSLTVNGNTYQYPNTGDEQWGDATTNWATAVTNGMLQKAGGTFTLTADVNFGASFGLLAAYFSSRSSNPSTAGQFRLANLDTGIGWRNAANNANLLLTVNSSNQLTFNSVVISAATAYAASRALVTDASGVPVVSATTSTQIAYLSAATGTTGTTSANIVFSASPTLTGTTTFTTLLTSSSSSATAGQIRLSKTESVTWRNNADSANLSLATTTSDRLQFDGVNIPTISSTDTLTNKSIDADTNTITNIENADIKAAAAIAVNKLAALTASRAVVTDGSGFISAATTTSTQIGYLSAATGTTGTTSTNIVFSTSPTFAGTVTLPSGSVTASAWSYGSSTFTGSGAATFTAQNTTVTQLLTVNGGAGAAGYVRLNGFSASFYNFIVSAGFQANDVFEITPSTAVGGSTFSNPAIKVTGSSGAVSIRGTNTNDSATTAFVGEYVESIVGPVSLGASTNYANVTSISLTAGDWDVSLLVTYYRNGATMTDVATGISTDSTANSFSDRVDGSNIAQSCVYAGGGSGQGWTMNIPVLRKSLSSTTTIYGKIQGSYSVATPNCYAKLSARRVR